MDCVSLSPEVLTWAAERNGESWHTVVESLASRDQDRERIRGGLLTIPQVERLAKLTQVPFGFLFLTTPPNMESPAIPDLRQALNPVPLDRNFYDQLDIVTTRQDWYRDNQRENGEEPLPFVGKFRNAKLSDSMKIASEIRTALFLTPADRKGVSVDSYYALLAKKVEDIGVLVMKSGIVGASTRRTLAAEQFRGFALVDDLAPVIFINGNDHEVAFSFTLIHELSHIWIGESGVSDLAVHPRGIEQLCNAIAGEVLVPAENFIELWEKKPDIDIQSNSFRVSRLTIARRALDLKLITSANYQEIALQSKRGAKKTESGGNPYATIPVRASKRFTDTLISSSLSQRTLLLDASRLLGCKVSTMITFSQKPRT